MLHTPRKCHTRTRARTLRLDWLRVLSSAPAAFEKKKKEKKGGRYVQSSASGSGSGSASLGLVIETDTARWEAFIMALFKGERTSASPPLSKRAALICGASNTCRCYNDSRPLLWISLFFFFFLCWKFLHHHHQYLIFLYAKSPCTYTGPRACARSLGPSPIHKQHVEYTVNDLRISESTFFFWKCNQGWWKIFSLTPLLFLLIYKPKPRKNLQQKSSRGETGALFINALLTFWQ